jgi:hypothetical protein
MAYGHQFSTDIQTATFLESGRGDGHLTPLGSQKNSPKVTRGKNNSFLREG